MTKARTHGAKRRLRKLSSRQIQQRDQIAEAANTPAPVQEDPCCVVLSARCRKLGRPDTKAQRAALRTQMAGDPAGQAIMLSVPNADDRARLWDAFVRLDKAHAIYHGRIIGQRRFPKTAKVEMMPDRFETSADEPMDIRSPDERDLAAIMAWRAQMALLYRLPVPDRMALHDGLWLRGDFIASGTVTTMGAAFVSALRALDALSDRV